MITDKFITEDLYITKEEHEDILKHTGAALYCRKDLLNEIEITPDAVCAYWQGLSIHCHHRNGKYASVEQLIKDDAYYDIDASELVILPGNEHSEVHQAPNRIADDIIKNGHSVPDFATAQIFL